jgi:8-oxo-dGTP diphosphatase
MSGLVVGAAIIARGRLLAAQRAAPPELAGGWELPGGKVEAGESDEEALVRECREELGVGVTVGRRVGEDWPLHNGYVMHVWTAAISDGRPQALEQSSLRWLASDELFDVPWLPADLLVLDALRDHLKES